MRISWAALVAVVALGAICSAARPLGLSDPLVALDYAKQRLADGRIGDALELFAALPPAPADEPYIAEEALLQQLLCEYALLTAAHSLLEVVRSAGEGDSAYAAWLAAERMQHTEALKRFTRSYLAATAEGAQLDFVRFALPRVTEEHLQDTELYSDVAIVGAAVTNWADGREGLGRGLIGTQSRVALVLAAAVHSDLPQAAAGLAQIEERLAAGVPLRQEVLLPWLAQSCRQFAGPGDGLAELAAQVTARLDELGLQPPPPRSSELPAAGGANTPDLEPSEEE